MGQNLSQYDRYNMVYRLEDIKKDFYLIETDAFDKNIIIEKVNNYNPSYTRDMNKMIEYYMNHRDYTIYEKTDCLCHEKLEVCIFNKNADKLRKINYGKNYIPNRIYQSIYYEK